MEFNINKSQEFSSNPVPQNLDSDFSTKQIQSFESAPHKRALLKANLSIADHWTAVQEAYEIEWRHQEFVLACYRSGCLYYASQKYARILNISPTEEIALKMQAQIEALANRDRLAKIKDEQTIRPSKVSTFIAVLGLLIAALGFIGPNFRNLVGVGISIFVMAMGLRYFVSKPL